MIHLEANFVQFKENLLPKEGNKALLTFPFLHIYWTDCCVSSLRDFVCKCLQYVNAQKVFSYSLKCLYVCLQILDI